MPWDVKWFLRSEDRAISEEERQALLSHAQVEEARPYEKARYVLAVIGGSGAVAGGSTQVPEDLSHPDWPRLLAALTALRAVVPGTRLVVEDSLSLITWNEEAQRYETRGWERAPTPEPPPAPPEDALDTAVRAALGELTTGTGDRYAQRQALWAKHQPERIARLGMALLPTLPKDEWPRTARSDLAQAIGQALERLPELPPEIEEAIRTLWPARPDADLVRHICNALEPAAAQPLVVKLAKAALESPDSDADTLSAVCQMLTRARAAADELVPVLVARARADRATTGREIVWRDRLLSALEYLGRPAAFATLLLDADADRRVLGRAASAMARCDAGRALPFLDRMKDCPGVAASSLVRALGDIALPAVVASLMRYLDHGEAATRIAAANGLIAHGRLSEVAAVWRTLDAAAYRRDGFARERALRAFGINDGVMSGDWDALVTARGEQPIQLPPLPTPLSCLAHPSVDVRSAGRSVLEEAAGPQHLLAMVLSYELEQALGKLGAPRGYPAFWKWRTYLSSLGCTAAMEDQVVAWIRQNLDRLPPQELAPELEPLRDGDLAAVAARCMPAPFALTAEERIALDAEEARVAAQAGQPPAAPAPIEAQDLFSGPHPEAQGPAMDARAAAMQVRPEVHDREPAALCESEVVELLPGETQLTIKPSGSLPMGTLGFRAVLRGKTRWLRLDAVEILARDGDGRPIITHAQRIEQKLQPAGRVDLTAFTEQVKLDDLRAAEAHAILRRPFQVLAQRYELPATAPTAVGRVALTPIASSQLVSAKASAYLRDASGMPLRLSGGLELDLLVEVALTLPTRTVSLCEVVLALRSPRGAVLHSRSAELTLPADGSPVVFQQLLGFTGDRASARYLEIAARGALTQRVPLCTFQVGERSS